ncbi:CTP-dependent riboflavin kinase [Methanothermococcus okinawensis]|uniref:Riboflavin kinase n=1 Tax=Methanothermococcus okinawensis (strain DSM 14208 / JCM 11175 / IH1) TaxID=647113 RepID=F8AL57_METOI|nr:CTP-dependent riboflavin kinase [Methanothermococcus okinawensis]AEH06498.1 Riboflavin kinase [Methanothermococcus okinawensis IH1]
MLNKLFGRVMSGKGEGRYYMSLLPYKEKFKDILGYEPYEGTLNIKLNKAIDLNRFNPLEIDDFRYENNKYYGVKLIPVKICTKDFCVKGAIVYPKKTEHSNNIIEIIAPIKLRKYLFLKNNDIVMIILNGEKK